MSFLVPCPGCGENRKADEGHALCRGCEGYAPRPSVVSLQAQLDEARSTLGHVLDWMNHMEGKGPLRRTEVLHLVQAVLSHLQAPEKEA